jgi:hypothetical protein
LTQTVAGDGSGGAIIATLFDLAGVAPNGSGNKSITLTADRGSTDTVTSATVTVTQSGTMNHSFTVSSNTLGPAFFRLQSNDPTAGTVHEIAQIVFVPGAVSVGGSTVAADPGNVAPDGVATSAITVTLVDSVGHVIPGKTVTLVAGNPSGVTIGAATPTVTDVNGQTTFLVSSTTSSGTPVVFTATSHSPTVAVTQTASVKFQ